MFQPLDRLEFSHRERLDAEGSGGGAIQRVLDERAFPGAGNAGDADEHVQGNSDQQVFQIVLGGAGDAEHLAVAGPACLRERDALVASQVSGGECGRVGEKLFARRCADDLSSLLA